MTDRSPLYRFEHDRGAPGQAAPLARADVLIVMLAGFVDAGAVQQLIAAHILDTCTSDVVASFRIDELYDYRARRPIMVFDRDRWLSYADPSLVVHRVVDGAGRHFWLVNGPEPDYQWERFISDLMRLSALLGVELVVSVHGIPMAIPHTRPVGMTAHGTDPQLLPTSVAVFDTVPVPASVTSLLELRLGESGRNAMGLAVHVPHYIANREFATGALVGLDALIAATGLSLDRDRLVAAAEDETEQITAECAEREGMSDLVTGLERQYDAFVAGQSRDSLLAEGGGIPTADEIGAQAEEFLRLASFGDPPQESGFDDPAAGPA